MLKYLKILGTIGLSLGAVAAVSATTLLVKARYDAAIESAVEVRLKGRAPVGRTSFAELGGLENLAVPEQSEPEPRDPEVARRIVDQELRDASIVEREIWTEQLKDRSPAEIREILSLRDKFKVNFGTLNDSETTFLSSHDEPPRTLPESCLEQASPIPVDAWERMSASIAALQAELDKLREELAAQRRPPADTPAELKISQ